jgi:predicted nucleotidyltransferase component of viral defense system
MSPDYLHKHSEFADLLRIVAREQSIDPALVEKDYWIMHSLFGLQQLGMTFELKGGTSLSKGFRIIDRFSEDIDMRKRTSYRAAIAHERIANSRSQ